jgi:hypothetical protein
LKAMSATSLWACTPSFVMTSERERAAWSNAGASAPNRHENERAPAQRSPGQARCKHPCCHTPSPAAPACPRCNPPSAGPGPCRARQNVPSSGQTSAPCPACSARRQLQPLPPCRAKPGEGQRAGYHALMKLLVPALRRSCGRCCCGTGTAAAAAAVGAAPRAAPAPLPSTPPQLAAADAAAAAWALPEPIQTTLAASSHAEGPV